MTEILSVDSILGPEGRIARRLSHYEPREQQLQMARKVAEALASDQHLIAEAGTGVGKSFAYLVPAILHATADQEQAGDNDSATQAKRKRRVLVATHTISLQEQLVRKDLPLLNSVIPRILGGAGQGTRELLVAEADESGDRQSHVAIVHRQPVLTASGDQAVGGGDIGWFALDLADPSRVARLG